MSLIIRQQLTTTGNRLVQEVGNAQTLLDQPIQGDSLQALGAASERLKRSISSTRNLLDKWTGILATCVAEDRAPEERLFNEYRVGEWTPIGLLDVAEQEQTNLDIRIDQIQAAAAVALPNPGAQPPAPGHEFVTSVRLPPLPLMEFDGCESQWGEFWTAFESAVHNNPSMSAPQKFSYLLGQLKGSARTLISGYALTAANYDIVIRTLCERYGDKDKLTDKLQTDLFNLSKPTNSASSLRSFYDQVECICRQLAGMGMDVDTNPFVSIAIKGKLPIELQTQMLGKEMEAGVKWTSRQWREATGRAVRLKEAVAAATDHSLPTPKAVGPPPLRSVPMPPDPIRRSFPVIGGETPTPPDPHACSLCNKGAHQPTHCPDYPTPEARRDRLAAQRRCFVCAREGHFSDSCPSKGNCPKCNGRHHFMLCFANKKYNQTASGANGIPLGARKPATVTNPVLVEFEGHSSEEMGHEHSSSEICGPVHQSGGRKKEGTTTHCIFDGSRNRCIQPSGS